MQFMRIASQKQGPNNKKCNGGDGHRTLIHMKVLLLFVAFAIIFGVTSLLTLQIASVFARSAQERGR